MSLKSLKSADSHTQSLILVWAVLVVLTMLSWWFRDHSLGGGPEVAVGIIVVISFIKVFMVAHSFMELKFAPHWLRNCFISWCVGSCVVLTGMAVVL